ncbi:MAG: virulence factor SrfB, partial [Bacteroidota bacterium]|nr:virulence factor SrfB [Bacteroidota bacterium]
MKNISLIANSGVQFHSFKVNLGLKTSAMKTSADFFEKEEIDAEGNKEYTFVFPHYHEKKQYFIELSDEITALAMDFSTGDIDEDKIPSHLIQKIPEHKIITVRARESLQTFENTWMPIPYLRKSYDGKKFQQGPETWAMIWYSRIPGTTEKSKYTHNVVLAFDTKCEDNDQAYLSPTTNDAKNSIFECATHWKDNSFYFARDWIQEWLKGDFDKKMEELGKKDEDYFFMHTSYYLTLLKIFGTAKFLPPVTLHTNDISIDVDLVLDIGNSRTTGILVESAKEGQNFEFTDAIPLQIRDITYPDKTYSDPFEMRIAFVKSSLGNEAAYTLSGNPKAFSWPSLVRIGPEAQRMAVLNTAENSNSIMSSPKRYLWDTEKRVFPWTYVSKQQDHFAKPALYGLAELFTEEGKYLERQRKLYEEDPESNKRPIPAINPYFSRSSIMAFAMAEIFLQAITFVNSYNFRKRQGQEFLPRKLKRIVLTCPTAMLQTEQLKLREHA